jgi:hypothetical protein
MEKNQWPWLGLVLTGATVIAFAVQMIVRTPLSTPLSADLANSFLATVAQVLAGILAIAFSVSVLAYEVASDRYGPRILSYFVTNPSTWLTMGSLLVTTLVSVVAIGVQVEPMFQWGFLAMTWLFVFCLLIFPYYFQQTLQLLDPRNLAERIKTEVLQALKKRDRPHVLDAITSLGDIAIKAFERGEDEITQRYLDVLGELQDALSAPDSILIPPKKDSILLAFLESGVRSPIVDQYYRVFQLAITKKNKQLTLHIVDLLTDAIAPMAKRNSGGEIAKGILLQQYQAFNETAVEHRDVSRFSLTRSLRDIIFSRLRAEVAEDILSICLNTLMQVNMTIIDRQDFEMWREELHTFSRISSVEDVYDSLYRELCALTSDLHSAKVPISQDQWTRWHLMAEPMRTRITATNKRIFELGLSEIERLIPESEQELQERARRVRQILRALSVTTGVYDVFFAVCVYAFYRRQFGYIKELWRHVNPPDASASWANVNLIHINIGFLNHQMFHQAFVDWPIEDYHGRKIYVLQYYLLCLAYALQQTNRDWPPMVPTFSKPLLSQSAEYSMALGQELSAVHMFLVNLPHYVDEALKQYETVVSMSGEWDDVLDGRGLDALEQAQKWLENTERRQEWKEKAESIIKNLPLDNSRIEAYKKAALEYYQSESYIGQLATTGGDGEKAPTELRSSWRSPEKRDFTLIGLGKPQEVGRKIGFGAVYEIVRAEVAHIVKIILEHEATDPIGLKQLTFNEMAKAVKKVDEAGYKATVLLAPTQQISSAWQNDPDFRTRMTHEGNDRYLMLNDSTRLRIVELDSNYALVLDSNAGIWTTVTQLKIEVAECAKDPLAVQITAQEVVDYQVLNPGAVEILKFG